MKKLILIGLMLLMLQVVTAQFKEGQNLTQPQLNALNFNDIRIFDCRWHYRHFQVSWDRDLGYVLKIPHTCLSIRNINLNESREGKVLYQVFRHQDTPQHTGEDFWGCMKNHTQEECETDITRDLTFQFKVNIGKNQKFVESRQIKDRGDIFRNLRCDDIFDCGKRDSQANQYECVADGRIKECPGGFSNPNAQGQRTRCYQTREPASWFSCSGGWELV